MASWGDLNARLNRLVREGVISGFRTNLGERTDPASLAVVVAPGIAAPHSAAGLSSDAALRARVALALADIAPCATISIEGQASGAPDDPRTGTQFG